MFAFFTQRAYCQLLLALAVGIVAGYHWPVPAALLIEDVAIILVLLGALAALWWLLKDLEPPYALLPHQRVTRVPGLFCNQCGWSVSDNCTTRTWVTL